MGIQGELFTPQNLVEVTLPDDQAWELAVHWHKTDDDTEVRKVAEALAVHKTASSERYAKGLEFMTKRVEEFEAEIERLNRDMAKEKSIQRRFERLQNFRRNWSLEFLSSWRLFLGLSVPFLGVGFLSTEIAKTETIYREQPELAIFGAATLFILSSVTTLICVSGGEEQNERRTNRVGLAALAFGGLYLLAKAIDIGVFGSTTLSSMGSNVSFGQSAAQQVTSTAWSAIYGAIIEPLSKPVAIFAFCVADFLAGGALVAGFVNKVNANSLRTANKSALYDMLTDLRDTIIAKSLSFRTSQGHTAEKLEADLHMRKAIEQQIYAKVSAKKAIIETRLQSAIERVKAEVYLEKS